MFLIVIKGTNVGKVFLLDKEGVSVIGRSKECDIQVLDLMVSRRHCQIEKTKDNIFYIKDLNSTNKTYVNSKIVEDVRELKKGDTIEIGGSILLFTDQKEITIKSVADFETLRKKQTMKIDLGPDQLPQKE